jgi:hypothetical protein
MSASERPEREAEGVSEGDETPRRDEQPAEGIHEVPLFLRDGSDGRKGNAQDEKDETGE